MHLVSKEKLTQRLSESAHNSAHYTWLIATDLKFLESDSGWIFAFKEALGFVVIALEPLAPAPLPRDAYADATLWSSIQNLVTHFGHDRIVFTAVGSEFAVALGKQGISSLQAGEEPWVSVPQYLPKGNAGKGLRSARNQALRAGLSVSELSFQDVAVTHRKLIDKLYQEWTNNTLWTLNGFLFHLNPYQVIEGRRYFAAFHSGQIEAFLVATPIIKNKTYYFEDLVYPRRLKNGATELVTLEALRILNDDGCDKVSLGIVMLNSLTAEHSFSPKCLTPTELSVTKFVLKLFYNSDGIELHRKRFRPEKWTGVFNSLFVNPDKRSLLPLRLRWLWASAASIEVCMPRPNISRKSLVSAFSDVFFRRPVAAVWIGLLTLSFIFLNSGGSISSTAIDYFAFANSDSTWTWLTRTLSSHFLSKSPSHFYAALVISSLIFPHIEKKIGSRRFSFVLLLLLPSINIIAQSFLIKPARAMHLQDVESLLMAVDTGCWPLLSVLLGFSLSQYKQVRNLLIVFLALILMILGVAYVEHAHSAIIILNYCVFLMIGFGVDKALRSWQSWKHKSQAKK